MNRRRAIEQYGVWLLGNPIDFLVFLGFPIAILLIYNLVKRIPFPKSLLPIAVATAGTLILLWLSGIVRGEVGRLWMYFGPLVVLIAVGWSEGDDSSGRSLLRDSSLSSAQPPCGTRHAPRFTC